MRDNFVFVKHRRASACAFVVVIAFLAFHFSAYLLLTRDEQQLHEALQHLPANEKIPLSKLGPLSRYTEVCAIDAYAVRVGPEQAESLRRIFGDIDYSQYRDEIIKQYSDWFTVFSVSNNSVTKLYAQISLQSP